eukprot:CAMPEP_0176387304 /NCGR_PEP_ID=MMETSP0126-20121128/36663_1 /TAXON_ID=141414 ORGANISM="Strombidinopsis acuminatum, Strain SPMC142" /NCGR_SAMPLE_ID=MMETSP0126 /ASSEMBLY_ACC=CAM_ASM_000229 /LENGTH=116 /DNA_ID=CAMNT_0017754825 /DNA_START=1846 /DNA_END=2196 /DNA_ORIENTATION=+
MPTHDLEAHQKVLNIRSLVMDRTNEIDHYLRFAKMAQETGNHDLSSKVLFNLKEELHGKAKESKADMGLMNEMAKVEIEIFQNIYNSNSYKEATNGLEKLIFENPNLEPKLKSLCF